MSMTFSAALSLTVADGISGNTSLTKQVANVSFPSGSELVYDVLQNIGTSPTNLTLPITPVQFLYLRNIGNSSTILTVNTTPAVLLSAPTTPSLTQTSGGSISSTTYYAKTTYVNQFGETVGSVEASFAVATNFLLKITSPIASGSGVGAATGYNVYVSQSSGTETKQNNSVIPIGTDWTEPTSGLLTNGSGLPVANTAGGSQGTNVTSRILMANSTMLMVDNVTGGGIYGVNITGNQPNCSLEYLAGA